MQIFEVLVSFLVLVVARIRWRDKKTSNRQSLIIMCIICNKVKLLFQNFECMANDVTLAANDNYLVMGSIRVGNHFSFLLDLLYFLWYAMNEYECRGFSEQKNESTSSNSE